MTRKQIYRLDDAGREAAKHVVREWTDIAFATGRTTPEEAEAIRDNVEALYRAANLAPPPRHRIVIATSPFVARFAAGAAAWIWHCRKNNAATYAATDAATRAATDDATYAATYAATDDATYAATDDATYAATRAATDDATYAATDDATYAATDAATRAATLDATDDATYAATDDATYAATDAATRAATDDATYAATYAATDDATRAATYAATYAATRAATDDATYAATDDATDDATYAATDAATRAATDDATYAATYAATDDATYAATDDATYAATDDATRAATYAATYAATRAATLDATYAATYAATRAATYAATDDATYAATDDATYAATLDATQCGRAVRAMAGMGGLECARLAYRLYQGGNMWAAWSALIAFGRDHAKLHESGLIDPSLYARYAPWEALARVSGFRFMHAEFCIVSERPVQVSLDEQGRGHAENGPYMRWADGTGIYMWHGTQAPAEWFHGNLPTASEALQWENMEQRRVACEMIGWARILDELDARTINTDEDPEIGELVEVDIPDIGRERFLRVRCGTGRDFALAVPPTMKTAIEANAWTWGLSPEEYQPEVRT